MIWYRKYPQTIFTYPMCNCISFQPCSQVLLQLKFKCFRVWFKIFILCAISWNATFWISGICRLDNIILRWHPQSKSIVDTYPLWCFSPGRYILPAIASSEIAPLLKLQLEKILFLHRLEKFFRRDEDFFSTFIYFRLFSFRSITVEEFSENALSARLWAPDGKNTKTPWGWIFQHFTFILFIFFSFLPTVHISYFSLSIILTNYVQLT